MAIPTDRKAVLLPVKLSERWEQYSKDNPKIRKLGFSAFVCNLLDKALPRPRKAT